MYITNTSIRSSVLRINKQNVDIKKAIDDDNNALGHMALIFMQCF